MTTEKFKPGDVVCLKSGSPKMTVVFSNNEGYVWVTWFDESNNTIRDQIRIHGVVLKIIE